MVLMTTHDDNTAPDIESDSTGPSVCPNCGADFQGRYCSSCGQRDEPLRQSVAYFVKDALVEMFGLDGRMWATSRELFLRPGSLTSAYIAGKRSAFIRPFRLYLSTTLVFFFLVSVFDPVGRIESSMGVRASGDSTATVQERLDVIDVRLANDRERLRPLIDGVGTAQSRMDSLMATASAPGKQDSLAVRRANALLKSARSEIELRRARFEWQRKVLQGFPPDSTIRPTDLATASEYVFPGPSSADGGGFNIALGLPEWAVRNQAISRMKQARTGRERLLAGMDFARGIVERLPAVMFVLLPVFALMLKVFYARGRIRTVAAPVRYAANLVRGEQKSVRDQPAWYYTEHLVFALHTHAYTFAIFSLCALALGIGNGAGWSNIVVLVLGISLPVYFVLAMKRVYKQGWPKTIIKFVLITAWYEFVLVSVGFLLAVMLAAVLG